MRGAALSVLGIGSYLPPSRPVRDLVVAQGGDINGYDGWDNICLAGADDHPSTMAARALDAALKEAAILPADLKLVVYAGGSRDYVPPWSVATEVMRLHDIPGSCIGYDIAAGCLGSLVALNLARAWLAGEECGYAAVITAERWSHTVDRSDSGSQRIWGLSDGATAIILGMEAPGRSLGEFRGAVFSSRADLNGYVLVKYGGTQYPVAPPGESPFRRVLASTRFNDLWEAYCERLSRVLSMLSDRFGMEMRHLVCNQINPAMVMTIADMAEIPMERVVQTGREIGHLGGSDIVLGLRRLLDRGAIDGPVALVSSTPYAFGAGLFVPVTARRRYAELGFVETQSHV
jgi:3-oxoacyl-[acyl-carrier-protein] synthase III